MKQLLLLITVVISLAACSPSVTSPSGNAYIKYKVNGQQVEMITSVGGTKLIGVPGGSKTLYTISGIKDQTHTISFIIAVDSLKPQSFVINDPSTNQSSPSVTIRQDTLLLYSYQTNIDVMNLTITRNSGGSIDGTFSGKLSHGHSIPYSGVTFTNATITDGSFQNVKIVY